MDHSFNIGKYFGIRVRLHYSWFIILFLLAYSLATGFFPYYFPKMNSFEYWFVGIVSSLLLFFSVLAHEFAHSLVAKLHKIKVRDITLFFFGGVAQIEEDKFSPEIELKVALAGPIFSLILGLIFWVILINVQQVYIVAITFYLFRINLLLAGFNLVPGYPLDGGRVFRALVWGFTKDLKKATKYASFSGKGFGILLVLVGFLNMLFGNVGGGFWFILLGGFLVFLAKVGYEQTIVKEIFSKLTVEEIMRKKFKTMRPEVKLEKAIKDYFLEFNQEAFPIVKKGKILGIITIGCIERVPRELWKKVNVFSASIPLTKVKTLEPKASSLKALRMITRGIPIILVKKKNRIVGFIDRSTIIRYLKFKGLEG